MHKYATPHTHTCRVIELIYKGYLWYVHLQHISTLTPSTMK